MDIKEQLNELFGKKKPPRPRPDVDSAVKKLSASRLPSELLKFALDKLDNNNYKMLDKRHKDALYWIIETDLLTEEHFPEWRNKNIQLVNDKLLYMVYQPPKLQKIHWTSWYSFRDRRIYRWTTEEMWGFYKRDGRTLTNPPVAYKKWMGEK